MLRRREAVKDSDRAYAALRTRIVELELPPGAVLNETDLMESLGVGRTPLREALQRLAFDSLVVIHPGRGSFVADISIDHLGQLWEVRLPLECQCARLATDRMTESDIAVLGDLVSQIEAAAADGNLPPDGIDRQLLIDVQLHAALAAGARNEYLADTLDRLYALNFRLRCYVVRRGIARPVRQDQDWRVIVEAIRRRDAEAAATAMREHVMQSRLTVLQAM